MTEAATGAGSGGLGGRSQILAGQRGPAPSRLPLVPQPLTRLPPAPRRRGETASCTTGTAAPVSTGRAPRSCSWLCSCCWLAAGASRLAGTWPVALGVCGGCFFPPLAAQGLGLSLSCPHTHPGRQGTAPRSQSLGHVGICSPLASCCQKQKGVGRAVWGPGLAGLQSALPPAGQDPQDPLPSHCQPRGGAGECLGALPPAAPQPRPHWAARSAEASGGRAETAGRH